MLLSKNVIITIIASTVLIVGASVLLVRSGNTPGKYDDFAKCLTEKGAEFYGAFWCPHCRNQKSLFGKSVEYINYIECSTPDGNSQLSQCTEKGIEGYPTWIFADGSRENGEVPLEKLAEKTGCILQ